MTDVSAPLPGRPTPFHGMLAPLNVAAYLTWLVLAASALRDVLAPPTVPGMRVFAGCAGSLGVLLLLLWRAWLAERRQAPLEQQRPCAVAQLPCALLACWGLPPGLQPILLVIVAAQLAVVCTPRRALCWMLLADAGLAAILVARYGAGAGVWISLLSMTGFQAFAALSTGYARAAERARDAALHAQAEREAAQALLDESTRGDERLRLSRELHDVVGHKLTALKLQLTLAAQRHAGDDGIDLCRQLADELLSDVRGVVGAMRRHDGIDLQQALAALVAPFAAAGPRIALHIDSDLQIADLARAQTLLRCAQEALTNALRHSAAAAIRIALRGDDGAVLLEVSDDGRGRRGAMPGHGLSGMRERLAAVGGTLELRDAIGGGTVLRAAVPA